MTDAPAHVIVSEGAWPTLGEKQQLQVQRATSGGAQQHEQAAPASRSSEDSNASLSLQHVGNLCAAKPLLPLVALQVGSQHDERIHRRARERAHTDVLDSEIIVCKYILVTLSIGGVSRDFCMSDRFRRVMRSLHSRPAF